MYVSFEDDAGGGGETVLSILFGRGIGTDVSLIQLHDKERMWDHGVCIGFVVSWRWWPAILSSV